MEYFKKGNARILLLLNILQLTFKFFSTFKEPFLHDKEATDLNKQVRL